VDVDGVLQLKSKDPNSATEVLYSTEFSLAVKMGIFMEIFYSPFMAEVLRLNLRSKKSNKAITTYNPAHFSGQKAVWADLEPGDYTFEIVALREHESN
jgi:hypothetical protein